MTSLVRVDRGSDGRVPGRRSGHRRSTTRAVCSRVGAEVGRPLAAALGDVDALQERRDHLAQLDEHHVRVVARLGQRVRAHAEQQLLVGLAGAVHADVGQRRRGQEAAQRVEDLARVACRYTKSLSPACCGNRSATQACMRGQQRAVGVEDPVHLADEAGAVRRVEHLGRAEVAVLAVVEPLVVRDVARRLLQVRHEASPLEHLREHVRRLLAREVDAAELRDGVVAVLDEDLLVELLRPCQPDGGVDGGVARDVEVADELVEEQPAQALGRARVPGEEGALDHLGQVDQGEYRLVEVRDVAPEDGLLVRGEALFGVGEHARPTIERG